MRIYELTVPGKEIVRLIRAEVAAAGGQPELYESAWKDYLIEEDFDRRAYGLRDGAEYSLVSQETVLAIEPRVERNYWVLKVVVDEVFGPRTAEQEQAMVGAELTLSEFERGLLSSRKGKVTVRLETQTAEAKRHFDDWLAALRVRHPSEPGRERGIEATATHTDGERAEAGETAQDKEILRAAVHELVGTLAAPKVLVDAVGALENAGFHGEAISVLASAERAREPIVSLFRALVAAKADSRTPKTPSSGGEARTDIEAAAPAMPFYIAGPGSTFAIVAAGGALAAAIGATMMSGTASAGPAAVSTGALLTDALLTGAVADRHEHSINAELARGGLVVWVRAADKTDEERARIVLAGFHASDVHIYERRG